MQYATRTYHCPFRGQRVTRISVSDPRGPREFFAIVPNDGGRQYREARDEALDVLGEVLQMVLHPRRDTDGVLVPAPEPGEVRWSGGVA